MKILKFKWNPGAKVPQSSKPFKPDSPGYLVEDKVIRPPYQATSSSVVPLVAELVQRAVVETSIHGNQRLRIPANQYWSPSDDRSVYQMAIEDYSLSNIGTALVRVSPDEVTEDGDGGSYIKATVWGNRMVAYLVSYDRLIPVLFDANGDPVLSEMDRYTRSSNRVLDADVSVPLTTAQIAKLNKKRSENPFMFADLLED